MASLRASHTLWLAVLCSFALHTAAAWAAITAPTEEQVKAVFVFNFSHFTEWPADRFTSPTQALVIGVLGSDSFAAQLEAVVGGEHVGEHPLQVRRLQNIAEAGDCHILYIDQSENARLGQALEALMRKGTLTVSDQQGAARRGVMVELARNAGHVRLLINVDSARAAGLTLSSKVLRPAEIVQTASGD